MKEVEGNEKEAKRNELTQKEGMTRVGKNKKK